MNIQLPFPDWILTTDIKVYKTKTEDNGSYSEVVFIDGKASYDEKSKTIMNAQRELITLSGMVVCKGDIGVTDTELLIVKIGDVKKRVYSLLKPKNPDGSVYSTELTLI